MKKSKKSEKYTEKVTDENNNFEVNPAGDQHSSLDITCSIKNQSPQNITTQNNSYSLALENLKSDLKFKIPRCSTITEENLPEKIRLNNDRENPVLCIYINKYLLFYNFNTNKINGFLHHLTQCRTLRFTPCIFSFNLHCV